MPLPARTDYETEAEYLDDAAAALASLMSSCYGLHLSQDDARQNLADSDGDVWHAVNELIRDMDWEDPRDERHYSPWFLNS